MATATGTPQLGPSTVKSDRSCGSIYPTTLSGYEIRLLAIHPSQTSEAPVECDLLQFAIDHAPPFEALSYNWGRPRKTKSIICNGIHTPIAENLFRALNRARLPHKQRLLWADAICINQDRVDEKNVQLPLMHAIYSKATSVVVWLRDTAEQRGNRPIGEDAERVASFLQTVSDHIRCCAGESVSKEEQERQKRSIIGLIHNGNDFARPLDHFFNNPYFRRVWCIQEVQLAQEGVVYYQHRELLWGDIKMAVHWMASVDIATMFAEATVQPMLHRVYYTPALLMTADNSSRSLLELISKYITFDATDPRDKVYGLLALAESYSFGVSLAVDYRKPVAEVYAEAVVASLRAYPTCHLPVAHSHYNKEYNGADCFRSWVPRWDRDAPEGLRMQSAWEYDVDAVTQWSLIKPRNIRFVKGAVCMRGLEIDALKSTLEPMEYVEDSDLDHGLHPTVRATISQLWGHEIDLNDMQRTSEAVVKMANTLTMGTRWEGSSKVPNLNRDDREAAARLFLTMLHNDFKFVRVPDDVKAIFNMHHVDEETIETWRLYRRLLAHMCDRHRLFWTSSGLYGLGPACVRPDDTIAVFFGAGLPYALRPLPNGEYLFLGPVYIDELVTGQFEDAMRSGKFDENDFLLL